MQPTFNHLENTKVYNSHHGWMGETKVKVNGKNWILSTLKRYNGTISTHCHAVQDEGNGSYSYMMFGASKSEDFYLNVLPKGTKATEKTIREAHFKALAEFDAKNEAGELPEVKKEYKIEVGQVIFTHGFANENARAIYKMEKNNFGVHYHTVLLDGSCTKIDDKYIRNFKDKFGIGVYYNEDEKISQEEIDELLINAHENMKQEAARREAQEIINKAQAEEKRKYLSQFQRADRRTTTNILKRHILKTWPEVQKVEIKTDVFSGGDSMDVTYYAPAEIKELKSYLSHFKEGSFNSMEDIYEYDSDKQELILEGHILQTYKYVSTYFTLAEKVEVKQPETVEAGSLKLVDYSEKAFAIIGDTKPLKDKLKELGGHFNFRLTCGAGWIFPKTKAYTVRKALNLI
jgi:hypothetical protein